MFFETSRRFDFSTRSLSNVMVSFAGTAQEAGAGAVFCPGFQKGRVPSEKGTFSAVNGPSKGHN